MTHTDYLEAYVSTCTKVLPEIAIRNAREDYPEAADLLTQLRAKLDSLWATYMATASAGVAP